MPSTLDIVRSESHDLTADAQTRADVARTIKAYRRIVHMVATIAVTHWPEIQPLRSLERQGFVENLIHPTALNPDVQYPMVDRAIGKMPSYLRRAAITTGIGAASFFLSNYGNLLNQPALPHSALNEVKRKEWIKGQQEAVKDLHDKARAAGFETPGDTVRTRGCTPPSLGVSQAFPSLFAGNMIIEGGAVKPARPPKPAKAGDKPKKTKSEKRLAAEARRRDALATPPGHVRIKLLNADGEWRFSVPLKLRGRMKRLAGRLDMAPTLMLRGHRLTLSCPVQFRRPVYVTNAEFGKLLKGGTRWRICAFDVGINTAVTAVIVDGTGTVIARTFLRCGRHNDQRDRVMDVISGKRSQSGSTMKGQPFCSKLYRRVEGLSLQAARELSSQLMAFATKHGAKVLACEDLKGWKPKGRGKRQRQRFHRFEHRKLVEHVRHKAEEVGLRVLEVYPRGTSRWAFDGSGAVQRSKENYSNATFASGKQYNADLNGAYNIAARGLARILGIENPREKQITESKSGEAHTSGKSPSVTERMPLVLADVWNWTRKFIAKVQTSLETDGPTQSIA